MIFLALGCAADSVAPVPTRLTWEGPVPYLAAVGAPVGPPSWPIVGDPDDEDGAWEETAARVCRGDPVARDAWFAALSAAVASAPPTADRRDAGLAEGLSCAQPAYCAWVRDRYDAADASAPLRAALVTAMARCDGPEDHALRIARLDAHLLAGDTEGALAFLAYLTDAGMPPWLSAAVDARYAAADEPMRDALAIGAAGSHWGPDDARAARLCLDRPELGPCRRRAFHERAEDTLSPDPAVDPDAWVQQWRADPVGLLAARPDLAAAVLPATERCAADRELWAAPQCLRALSVLAPERARAIAASHRAGGVDGELALLADEIADAPKTGVWLGLSGEGLLQASAARAGRALRADEDCEPLWRAALAPDRGLDAAPKRVIWRSEAGVTVDVWVDGWRWRAELGEEDVPCPLRETVAVANTRLRARGSPHRWGLVAGGDAVLAPDDAWRAAVAAGVISAAVP